MAKGIKMSSYKEAFNGITNEKIREWYSEHIAPLFFLNLIKEFEKKGYKLDPNSGLLIRFPYSEETIRKIIGRTIIDIIFPRPTDFHYHEDVDEVIYVCSGKGAFYGKGAFSKSEGEYTKLGEVGIDISGGDEIYIPSEIPHTLGPRIDEGLEIRLVCDGIMNPEKEICISPFDEFAFWPNYYDWPDYYDKEK